MCREEAGKLGQVFIWRKAGKLLRLSLCYEYSTERRKWGVLPVKKYRLGLGIKQEDIASYIERPDLLERWRFGDVIAPAKYYVCREVNKRLEGHVSPEVFPFVNGKIFLRPDSLYAALWLMVLNEITGNLKIRQCDVCGEWKKQSLARSTFYCSNACRQKAYRNKNKRGTK